VVILPGDITVDDIQQFILSKLEKLDEKLDEVREHNVHMRASFDGLATRDEELHRELTALGISISKHSELLDEYNQQLEKHIKRTDILEQSIIPIITERAEQKAVSKWREGRWAKAAKVAGWLSAIGGLVVIIFQLASKL
jgi:uncharacterized coiled-coil DUF342 family protein